MHTPWKNGAAAACTVLVVAGASAGVAHASAVTDAKRAATTVTHSSVAARVTGPGQRSFTSTTKAGGTASTLRVVMDRGADGGPVKLTGADGARMAEVLAAGAALPKAVKAAGKKGPATLRCSRNPRWSDARGTLGARFNCRHNTVNWGYKISAKVKDIITSKVDEQGVWWWKNGKRQPKNAGHAVDRFHGTLKPVEHGDRVQLQDHMTFRVNVGGKTGTGSLTWAADVKAKK
jgi:hypothetical protein